MENNTALTRRLNRLGQNKMEMKFMVIKTLDKREEDIIARNYWNPEEIGETLEGYIRDIYDSIFQDDDGNKKNLGKVMLIEDPDGEKWETKPHVDLREYIPQLKIGDYIVITLSKLIEPRNVGGYPKKIYEVGIDDGN